MLYCLKKKKSLAPCVCFRSSLRVCARGGTGYTFGAFSILVRLPMGEPGEFRAARSVPVDTSHLPPGTVGSQGATGLVSPVARVCRGPSQGGGLAGRQGGGQGEGGVPGRRPRARAALLWVLG